MNRTLALARHGLLAALLAFATTACAGDTPTIPVVQPPVQVDAFAPLTAAIDDGKFGRIESVIVESGGTTLYEAYFRGNTASSRIDVKSVGKSLTALAVGAAIDDGDLAGTDVKVWDYLVGNAAVANDGQLKRAITVGDLLSMSSALDCNDWVASSPGQEEKMYGRDDWSAFALDLPIDPQYREVVPGQGRFSYCTAGVFLLGQVVEKAVGMRFDTYVQQRIFAPIGIAGADWRKSPTGEVQSGGQIGVTAQTLATVGRMVMNGGELAGQRVVSRDWLRVMLAPKVGATPDTDYAYLWWTRFFDSAGGTRYGGAFMLGNGANMAVLLPQIDTVIVIQTTNYNRDDAFADNIGMIENLILPAVEQVRNQ